jgi:hypothetical protein
LPQQRKTAGFLGRNVMVGCNISVDSQIEDTIHLDDIRPRKQNDKHQLIVPVGIEELKMKKTANTSALIDSGCIRTCVDEQYAQQQGWPLLKIPRLIRVQYADGSSNEASMIRYSVDLRIRVAGSVVVTGALVTRLKSIKVFLGYDWLCATNPTID